MAVHTALTSAELAWSINVSCDFRRRNHISKRRPLSPTFSVIPISAVYREKSRTFHSLPLDKQCEAEKNSSNTKFLLWRTVYRCKCHILPRSFWSCWRGWGLQTRRHGGGISCVHTRRWTHPGSGVDPALLGSPGEETPPFTCVTGNNTIPTGILTSCFRTQNKMTSNSKIALMTHLVTLSYTNVG